MRRQRTSDYTHKKANQASDQSIIGFVTKVFEHDGTENVLNNHAVNVQAAARDEEFRRCPVHTTHNGGIYVPQENDAVELNFLNSESSSAYVSNVVYTDQIRAPLGRSGHLRHEFNGNNENNLYIEAEPRDHSSGDAETVRMAVKEDGLSDPVARIEIDLSGSEPVLRMTRGEEEQDNTDMGIELDFGSGEFKIGDGSGYGIESDGDGNFTWYYETLNEVTDGSTISW